MDIVRNFKSFVDQSKQSCGKSPVAKPKVTAIVVAAGRGERMGTEIKKQFLPLCGVSVLTRTLSAFEASRLVGHVIVVTSAEDMVEIINMVRDFGLDKVIKIVKGGDTRQKSAAAGLGAAQGAEYIAIHDGVRPLITPQCIDRVIEAAFERKAVTAAVKLKDTVKQSDESGNVLSTPDRSCLWAVQTPQVFETALYRSALDKAIQAGEDYTDDCQLIEAIGGTVRLIDGEYTNIKITTKEDILFAEAILRSRGEA